jgi:uncharacterized protein
VQTAIHRFVRFLQHRGVRVSTVELLDAMEAVAAVSVQDREAVRVALASTLLKDRRDQAVFNEVFDRFFHLRRVQDPDQHHHDHAHDDLRDGGEVDRVTLSEEPAETPDQGHSHGKPSDMREYFDPEDLHEQYNLHQEANRIDLAALTDEIVLATDQESTGAGGDHVEIEVEHLSNPTMPTSLSEGRGETLDVELSVAQQQALLGWLADEFDVDADELREALTSGDSSAFVDQLPELLRRYLQRLLELDDRKIDTHLDGRRGAVASIDELERNRIEEELRRLARSLDGGLTHRRRPGPRGRIDVARTMRSNMRHDGVPFRPVTVARVEDRPHLVLLVDVSLSVRATTRFALEVVHQLQSLFPRVRTFAFVDDLVEVTDLFADHHLEDALELLMGGDVIDVDAQSDYGRALTTFEEEFTNAVTRRSSLLVLGDGRTNGQPSGSEVFERIAERARHVIWWTPEPRRTWGLGLCAMNEYEIHCDAVEVVRGTSGLARTASRMSEPDRVPL